MPDGQWVVHLASFEVVIGERLIQRCSVCGTKLADVKGVETTEQGPKYECFRPQTLVAEREGVFRPVNAPDDFYPETGGCLSLVEE